MEKFAIITRFDDQSKQIGDKIKQVLQSYQYEYNQENPKYSICGWWRWNLTSKQFMITWNAYQT